MQQAAGGGAPPRVLVVGERRGLCDALRRQDIAFAVWNDPARRVARAEFVHGAPLHASEARARDEAALILERHGRFSHVIAGSEAAVLAAAVARRVLGARLSAHTTVMRCRDKLLMKRHLARRGVPMTPFADVGRGLPSRAQLDALGDKVVVKERVSSGGRGLVVVEGEPALADARGPGRIAERFVDAPEASVESFVDGHRVLFENVTEYVRKGRVNLLPGRLAPGLHDAVLALNRRVIDGLRIDWGLTHVELYLTEDGPLFGEIALRPPGGYIMELLEMAWGFSAWDAFVAVELGRPVSFPAAARRTAGVSVLHPGAGRVARIDGADALRSDPRVARVVLKVAAGDAVGERVGVGHDVGHVLFSGRDRAETLDALRLVDATLRIALEPGSGPGAPRGTLARPPEEEAFVTSRPAPALTGKQRRWLRGRANPLEALVHVGQSGLAPAVVAATSAALDDHELVKVRLHEPDDKKGLAREIADATGAALCGLVGHTVILYRPNPEKPKLVVPGF